MGDMNFVRLDGIKDEITKARNDYDPRIRLVDFATLIRYVLQSERPIDQAGDYPRGRSQTVLTDIVINTLKVFECRPGQADFHPAWRR